MTRNKLITCSGGGMGCHESIQGLTTDGDDVQEAVLSLICGGGSKVPHISGYLLLQACDLTVSVCDVHVVVL